MANTKRLEIYKCNVCGNIVEVFHTGAQNLVCCGQKMELKEENTQDAATEKHVPVIEKIEGGYKVKVGEAPHPMIKEHYIEWIELVAGNKVYTQFLTPDDEPEAIFKTDAEDVYAREYCNIHGHWSNTE